MEKEVKYNIGLDIGTGSIGWCVTDDENNLIKKSGKHLWGSRLFDEGQTAAQTRAFRGVRRRTERRKERIKILQGLLKDDIKKIDSSFFERIQKADLIKDDNNQFKFNLFEDTKESEKKYYDDYQTIYHLRDKLVNSTEKFDIRLVYLAIHHIMKYRGNFLTNGEISNDISNIENDLEQIIEFLDNNQIELKYPLENITNILTRKDLTKSEKEKEITSLFEYEKEDKGIIQNVWKSIVGLKFDLNAIFNREEKRIIEFSSDNDWDLIASEVNENAEIFYSMKNIYSWTTVQSFLSGKNSISKAFIEKFEKYKNDLNKLKKFYKKYLDKPQYDRMFKKYESSNYYSYNGKELNIKGAKKCLLEDLYKRIKNDLKGFEEEKIVSEILEDIANENFLVKLNTTINGEIPYQLHEKELIKILENQSRYYPTIKENKDKIISLLKFRIPYYVGPLSKENSKWSWVIRKKEGKILPWTFDEIVDKEATAEEFIRRMTNKCTYLINEDVIPKESLLYTKYCVLNEINNLQVNRKRISKDMKKKILELFKTKKNSK